MWTLDKCSLPDDWKKEFRTKRDATAELRKHICRECLRGYDGIADSKVPGGIRIVKSHRKKPNPKSTRDLLGTPCGLEFEVYKTEDGPGGRFFVKVRRGKRKSLKRPE